jgi:hypothetical protein
MDGDLKARLDNWFENGFASPLDHLASELQKLGEELRQVHETTQRIRERLAEKPSLKSSAEPLLGELGQQRERLAQALVEKWIDFLQRGGRLTWTMAQGAESAGGPDSADTPSRRRATPPPREYSRLEAAEQRALLRDLMLAVGEPRDLAADPGLVHEVEALEAATQLTEQERWKNLSRELQRSWLSMMVARTRGLKERIPLPPGMWGRINQILIRYPVFAKSAAPGHVNGLQAAHKSEGKSWRMDALTYWQDLVRGLNDPPAQEENGVARSNAAKWEGVAGGSNGSGESHEEPSGSDAEPASPLALEAGASETR